MSQFGGVDKSFHAGADLNTSTSDFRPVYINSTQSVDIANTTTVATNTIGILQNRPASGTGASCWVRVDGMSKVYLNDTCTAGDIIMIGSGGAVRGTAVTATASRTMLGRALEGSAATGTVIEIALNIHRAYVNVATGTANFIMD